MAYKVSNRVAKHTKTSEMTALRGPKISDLDSSTTRNIPGTDGMSGFIRSAITGLSMVLFGALVACTPKEKTVLEKLGGEEPSLFSNRQINQDEFVAVVKLQSPPLLSRVTRGPNGKTQISADLVKSIDSEQEQAILELKKLSSDIRVIYRYRMILNGFAIVAPIELKEKLKYVLHVAYVEQSGIFGRPVTFDANISVFKSLLNSNDPTSVEFIGSAAAYDKGFTGKGMKVGIVDTGIDYTHSMLGGSGSAELFKSIDPAKPHAAFPNSKVVGGIDLVGTEFDSGSGDYKRHVPVPDENPLDQGGHGSHVAGTVAGIGDGQKTYSGVAPEASLFAIKVFGAEGSTGDAVVIAGLEYAADPNRDGILDDQLDVINMSLGSSYGTPHVLYEEAIGNLVNGGTVVVASAGNSGPNDYIVGAPSIVEEAISVAASVDDMNHNWKFSSIKFTAGAETMIAEVIQGPVSKPVEEVGDLSGKLVHVGLASTDFSPEVAAALKGNVALIDRGSVTFAEKVGRAASAGAVGVIVANNQASAPIAMGGDGHFDIPAVMITQALGSEIKSKMAQGQEVIVHFKSELKVEKPELIDTLTGFSSKGPRSIDGLLKPEISAPGANIISAKMGGGTEGVQMSGTSMAGPHIAGVMALLKQVYPNLSPLELKTVLMGHGKTITDEKKNTYPLSRQGAGRVQVDKSLNVLAIAQVVEKDSADQEHLRSSVSLGELNIENQKILRRTLAIKSLAKLPLSISFQLEGSPALSLMAEALNLDPEQSKNIEIKLKIDLSKVAAEVEELDGFINMVSLGKVIHRVPVLAVVKRISRIEASQLKVMADSKDSADEAIVKLDLANSGVNKGIALPFNLIALDGRKQDAKNDRFMSKYCDLQAAGYRIVDKEVDGQKIKVLQIGAKTYDSMTTWNTCELSVQLDVNGDQVAEQELGAVQLGNYPGLSGATNEQSFASVLFDAAKVRKIRGDFEMSSIGQPKKPTEDYSPAVVDMFGLSPFRKSSVIIVEADITKLMRRADGTIGIKIATIMSDLSSVEMDDFLANAATEWKTISLQENSQAYKNLPESVEVEAGKSQSLDFEKGQGGADLLLLYPENRSVSSDTLLDNQIQVLAPVFGF